MSAAADISNQESEFRTNMEIIREIQQTKWNNTALTIGKFDGVHIGHRILLDKVLAAKNQGCVPTVFSFDMLPVNFLKHQQVPLLLTETEKEEILEKLGMKRYVLFPFQKTTASMEPEQFVKEILVDTMKVKQLFVGTDFRFGRDRKGDVKLLEKLSAQYGFSFEAVKKHRYQGAEVSSSRIRDCICKGQMEEANEMLGMPYQISGEIVHGQSLGHTIGVPTINQNVPDGKIVPRHGVYCARVTIDGNSYHGIANIGCKPTVQKEALCGIETHLFDCTENLYGKVAKTELFSFVRPEQKFATLEELRTQLLQDIQTGKAYFG